VLKNTLSLPLDLGSLLTSDLTEQFNESLAQVKQQLGIANGAKSSPTSTKTSNVTIEQTGQSRLPSLRRENSAGCTEIRIASRTLPFPSPAQYRHYLDFFFDDINACHPCVNESDFRVRSEAMLASPHLDRRESCFLALHYIVFACADILQDYSPLSEDRVPPGSHW
jgi:hypothetical protein